MNKFFNMFHLLTLSPWPLIMSFNIMILMVGFLKFFFKQGLLMFLFGLFMLILSMFQWWRDVIRESIFLGCHSMKVMFGMKLGMMMFILSEIMFFMSFFWCYFHNYLSPSIEIGMYWEPLGISVFDPYGVPLMNTMILLSSGMLITWCHMLMIMGNKNKSMFLFFMTILMGILFTLMQLKEYSEAVYSMNDSVYGSIFYMLTGFHGLHVLIGTLFMMVMFLRLIKNEIGKKFHLGFDFCSWYWHFVDVIWLILYFLLYYLMIFY